LANKLGRDEKMAAATGVEGHSPTREEKMGLAMDKVGVKLGGGQCEPNRKLIKITTQIPKPKT